MANICSRVFRYAQAARPGRFHTSTTPVSGARFLSTTRIQRGKKDDLMDKDSIDTTSTEYSKSGGDGAAAHESGAFDPSTTQPEQESQSKDSLKVSPGNPGVSQPRDEQEGGAERSPAEAEGRKTQTTSSRTRKGGSG